eukprot:749744-Hanusia_phi.AAC.3
MGKGSQCALSLALCFKIPSCLPAPGLAMPCKRALVPTTNYMSLSLLKVGLGGASFKSFCPIFNRVHPTSPQLLFPIRPSTPLPPPSRDCSYSGLSSPRNPLFIADMTFSVLHMLPVVISCHPTHFSQSTTPPTHFPDITTLTWSRYLQDAFPAGSDG